jgi:superfamily II DNA or RNA helicase
MITRKFNEIANDKYKVITHRIEQNDNEKMVYSKIMNEFYQMIPNYYKSTGSSRKDAMLRIIRQLQLMIKAVSIPHMLKEYKGMEEPNKYSHIEKLISENDEKIILGTVFKDACNYYHHKLSSKFPNRPIFMIKGDTAFRKRQQIIEEFEATSNGLLICTQQSLSESVNIPTCNIVICEALQWNCPTIEQFYFRTIRLDSKYKTSVYMVTYDNTIEQNILALLMSKERINEYIRTLEDTEQAEIFESYGIDLSVFNSIITKDVDEDGHVKLTWGNQKIVN